MEQIQALAFQVQEVGKHVKGSKKRFVWQLLLKDKHHTIALDFSFISGKVKITVDRKILLQNQLPANVSFQYPFTLDGFALNVIQQGQSFQLRINNKVFSHLYNQHKTNTQFKKYQDQVKDIKVNLTHLNPPDKKITLNIGGMGGNPAFKKKKQTSGSSQNWDAFTGGSFPNYFGQSQTQSQKPKQSSKKIDLLQIAQQKTQKQTNNNMSLIDSFQQTPKTNSQSFFDMGSTQKITQKQQFNTMQNMFKTINISPQPPSSIDFFAQTTPVTQPTVITNTAPQAPKQLNLGLDFQLGVNNFSTGLAPQPKIDSKAFTTGFPSTKQTQLNFNFNKPVDMTKKSSQGLNYSQMSNIFAAEVKPASPIPQSNIAFTQQINNSKVSDFNTLPNIFQTNIQSMPVNNISLQNTVINPPTHSVNPNDFSSMQLLFQTNNFNQSNIPLAPVAPVSASSQLNFSLDLSPPNPQPSKLSSSSLQFLNNNVNPTMFATSIGNVNNTNTANFGTMQYGQVLSQNKLDFFAGKPQTKAQQSNGLI